jgi:hypothetical protein
MSTAGAKTPPPGAEVTGIAVPTTSPINGAGATTQATANQLALGNNQWIELRATISQLTRVGTDPSRTLANINSLEILVHANVPSSALVLNVGYDSLYITGGFGADVGDVGNPYVVRYRYRSSLTGEISNVSPPARGGVSPRRQRLVYNAGGASTDAQADLIDWFRFGGTLDRFTYTGTGPNSTGNYTDDLADGAISGGVTPTFDDFQPWPTLDIRRSGQCTVAGPALLKTSGDNFNVNWAPGSLIIVNGRACTIDRVISATVLHLNENAGSGTGQAFEVPGADILGQPLPALWGPDNDNVFYACGDPNNPGTLYWSKPGSPDTTSDQHSLIVTSGSEILQHGFVWDGQPYVASTETIYVIENDPANPGGKVAKRTAVTRGFWSRYGFCVGHGFVYYVAQDGIAVSNGGAQEILITDPDLTGLFPQDGIPGSDVNGIEAPDMNQPDRLQLSWVDSMLYFDYATIDGHDRTLLFDTSDEKAWGYDLYPIAGIWSRLAEPGAGVHNQVLGSSSGDTWVFSGQAGDNGSPLYFTDPLPWGWSSSWEDFGDPRAQKQFGDIGLNWAPATCAILVTPVVDDGTTALATMVVGGPTFTDRDTFLIEINSGAGQLARNLGIQVSGQANAFPLFYYWEPTALAKADITGRRASDWDTLGTPGAKFVQGVIIRANTFGQDKLVQVQHDESQVALTLTINHNGESAKAYPLAATGWTPFIAHQVRLVGADDVPWQFYDAQTSWVYEPSPELATEWMTQPTSHDLPGYFSVRDMLVGHQSTSLLTLTIYYDGVPQAYAIAPSNGVYQRDYIALGVGKGRSVQYQWTSAEPFALFKRDMSVRVQGWGIPGGYRSMNPFGGPSRVDGAGI